MLLSFLLFRLILFHPPVSRKDYIVLKLYYLELRSETLFTQRLQNISETKTLLCAAFIFTKQNIGIIKSSHYVIFR